MESSTTLEGRRIAAVITDGFEQVEFTKPRDAILKAGGQVDLVSPSSGHVRGWEFTNWGDKFPVDVAIDQANASDYDGLLLPGGVMNPDKLRRNETVLRFVRSFFDAGKPVAVICHGPWTLIDAGVVRGRDMTSYESLQTDLRNAGANWSDQEVVVCRRSNTLVSSRKPSDIPAFNRELLQAFAQMPQHV